MWRRAILAFLGSVLGAGAGLALLYAALIYVYGGSVEGGGGLANIAIALHIFIALAVAAAIWGLVIDGIRMGFRAGVVCLETLMLSGPAAYGMFMVGTKFPVDLNPVDLWRIMAVSSTIAGAAGAAFMGWRLGGTRLIWRAALVGALPTGLIFPFVILTTYLGAVIPRPAALKPPDTLAGSAATATPEARSL